VVLDVVVTVELLVVVVGTVGGADEGTRVAARGRGGAHGRADAFRHRLRRPNLLLPW
jgi:hypothetical protein